MIKAVLIDFDDTLCLTESACFNLENEVLLQMGRPKMSRNIHKKTWGIQLFEAITMRSPGIDTKVFEIIFKKTKQKHIKNGIFDQITIENLDTLKILSGKNKFVALLTSRKEVEVDHLMHENHGLYKLIREYYYFENTKFHKPDPKVFSVFLEKHNLKPEECVYVGDSISDAIASNKAGLKFIASLEGGLKNKKDFSKYHVDCFIDEFTELPKAIELLEI